MRFSGIKFDFDDFLFKYKLNKFIDEGIYFNIFAHLSIHNSCLSCGLPKGSSNHCSLSPYTMCFLPSVIDHAFMRFEFVSSNHTFLDTIYTSVHNSMSIQNVINSIPIRHSYSERESILSIAKDFSLKFCMVPFLNNSCVCTDLHEICHTSLDMPLGFLLGALPLACGLNYSLRPLVPMFKISISYDPFHCDISAIGFKVSFYNSFLSNNHDIYLSDLHDRFAVFNETLDFNSSNWRQVISETAVSYNLVNLFN